MDRYDPNAALDELNEDAVLPHPVRIRDMIIRSQLTAEQALELNRKFQDYLKTFGEAQGIARALLEELAGMPHKA
jgi:hypothetical protein